MNIGIIAILLLVVFGLICLIAPKACTRADMRDDPKEVERVKKLGVALVVYAVVAGLLVLKYKLR